MSKAVYLIMEKSDNNRYYVGSSIDIERRMKRYHHKQRADRFIDRSLNKHGFSTFYKYIFNMSDDISDYELKLWEGFYIRLFGSYHYENEMGMNLIKNPQEAPSINENSRRKISKANKGIKKQWLSEKNKNNKYGLGRTGSLSPISKKVIFIETGKIFESITDAANFLNITRPAMAYRIKNQINLYRFV